MHDLLSLVSELQERYLAKTGADYRKAQGQVFTPPEIARFMASLLSDFPRKIRLLDPGAGVGCLTAAICERIQRLRSPRALEVHLFENETSMIELLTENMENCRHALKAAGHCLHYQIHEEDFVSANSHSLYAQKTFGGPQIDADFDAVIMNPPYFKLQKSSEHAKLMARVVHGQPNAYAFFLTLGAQLLKSQGELVAITPRSFCNGLYFRGFRKWFFQRMSLDHVHLFESRTEAFKESGVLQESVITKLHRLGEPTKTTTITTSIGRNLDDVETSQLPTSRLVDQSRGHYFVRIACDAADQGIMQSIESLPQRFAETGLKISTGPVVMFRATQFLLAGPGAVQSVPLLQPHNVKPFETVWPVRKARKPVSFKLCTESMSQLLPTSNYVLLKRFSAKEEKRRLTAGCILRNEQASSHLAIENHLNYLYHATRELTEDETFGLAALFNSVLFDRYFRMISGNTQVNATEIRDLHFPDVPLISKIGARIRQLARRSPTTAESIVLDELGIDAQLKRRLLEQVA